MSSQTYPAPAKTGYTGINAWKAPCARLPLFDVRYLRYLRFYDECCAVSLQEVFNSGPGSEIDWTRTMSNASPGKCLSVTFVKYHGPSEARLQMVNWLRVLNSSTDD